MTVSVKGLYIGTFVVFVLLAIIVSGAGNKIMPLREPDNKLNWVNMALTDKSIVGSDFSNEPDYIMIFKSTEHGTIKYEALSVSEYSAHKVGDIVSVGIGSDGYIHSIHHGNDYGQFYRED